MTIEFLQGIKELTEQLQIETKNEFFLKCSEIVELQNYNQGDPLIHRGSKVDNLYILIEGEIGVYEQKPEIELKKQEDTKLKVINMLKSSNSNKTQEQQIERPKQDKINQKDSSNPKQNEHPQDPNTSETQNTSKPGLLKKILTKTKSNLKGLMFQAEASNRLQKLKSSSEVDPVLYEELLLLNEECQRKYFYEGTCSMKFVEKISPGNIFNEKILLQDYRSPRTFVALTDCSVLALNKNVFAKIFEELVARINFRRDFLQHFFHYPSQVMISRLLKCTREVEYRMNDKIYAEGEKSKGVYIITSGEVKIEAQVSEERSSNPELDFDDEYQLLLNNPKRKPVKTIGILTRGDFFGEELFLYEKTIRSYSAIANTHQLSLIYLDPIHFPMVKLWCPDVVNTMREKSTIRNRWLKERKKMVAQEEILEKSSPRVPTKPVQSNQLQTSTSSNENHKPKKPKGKKYSKDTMFFQRYRILFREDRKEKEVKEAKTDLQTLLTNKLYFRCRSAKLSNRNDYFHSLVKKLSTEAAEPQKNSSRLDSETHDSETLNLSFEFNSFRDNFFKKMSSRLNSARKRTEEPKSCISPDKSLLAVRSLYITPSRPLTANSYRESSSKRPELHLVKTDRKYDNYDLESRKVSGFYNASQLDRSVKKLSKAEIRLNDLLINMTKKIESPMSSSRPHSAMITASKYNESMQITQKSALVDKIQAPKIKNSNSAKKKSSLNRVLISSHHNLFRLKPKEKLIIENKYRPASARIKKDTASVN